MHWTWWTPEQALGRRGRDPWNHGCGSRGTSGPSMDRYRVESATWLDLAPGGAPPPPPQHPLIDRQGLATFLAGVLLLLISFNTNYCYGDLQHFVSLAINEQIGMGLHLAALAALFSDVELASRLRHRAANETARAARTREQEAYEAARDREQAARRSRIQNGCLAAQCRFLLADSARNRLQLSETLAVLLEELRPPKG